MLFLCVCICTHCSRMHSKRIILSKYSRNASELLILACSKLAPPTIWRYGFWKDQIQLVFLSCMRDTLGSLKLLCNTKSSYYKRRGECPTYFVIGCTNA